MHMAAMEGDVDMTQLLIDAGGMSLLREHWGSSSSTTMLCYLFSQADGLLMTLQRQVDDDEKEGEGGGG